MVTFERAVLESGLRATILRPSGFMSNTLQWTPQLAPGDAVRASLASVGVGMMDPRDIGSVAAPALSAPTSADQTHRITGPQTLRPTDRVRILADVLGRELTFEAQRDEAARRDMAATMPPEHVDALYDFYADGSFDDSAVLSIYQDITGRPPRTFEQWARAHAAEFTAYGSHGEPTP